MVYTNCKIFHFFLLLSLFVGGCKPSNNVAIEKGNAALSKADYDLALSEFNEAIRINPNDASSYHGRGLAYAKKNDWEKAIADYTEAIRLNPKFDLAYCNRGLAYLNKDELDKAIADFTEAIRLDAEKTGEYQYYRANAYQKKGDKDKAISGYTEAIKLNPKYGYAFLNRALLYHDKGELDNTIADLNAATQMEEKGVKAGAYFVRGDIQIEKRNWVNAIADFTEVIQLAPNNDGSGVLFQPFKSGIENESRGEMDEAIVNFSKALWISIGGKDIALIKRGLAYEGNKEWDKAITDFTEAIEISANSDKNVYCIVAYISRGICYKAKGDFNSTSKDRERVNGMAKSMNIGFKW